MTLIEVIAQIIFDRPTVALTAEWLYYQDDMRLDCTSGLDHGPCLLLCFIWVFLPGVNPQDVRGTKTGVFIGCSASESHEVWTFDMEKIVGYEMTGCTRSMFANRLSFFFDFKGWSSSPLFGCVSSSIPVVQG